MINNFFDINIKKIILYVMSVGTFKRIVNVNFGGIFLYVTHLTIVYSVL